MENPADRPVNNPADRTASRSASIVPAITFERLRRVAREARPLLPLVVLALREERIPASDDLAAELRRLFLRSGLEPASWRYLLRHGVSWLRPVWLVTPEPHGTDASIDVLLAFAAAGHPPPPTAALLRGWMIAAHEPEFGGAFTGVPPAVLAILCASDRTIAGPAARNDQDLVLSWAAAVRPRLDKHQRRAGWPWLVERARAWARDERLPPPPGGDSAADSWPTPLVRFASGGFEARALGDAESLASTALAFRNCLADLAWPCQGGTVHVFVVHANWRAVAVAAIQSDFYNGEWALMDIRGRFNQEVPQDQQAFGAALVEAFRAAVPPATLRAADRPVREEGVPYPSCQLRL